ncbi:MAG: GTP 3',8-cyclase MoaA [Candidatus Kapabacteria bacterium]|nr:GTP 3',8-cyclase MoaA [Candidatus Kapabacteria bacterium]
MKLTDKYNRVHNYLRLSVTDRCNLRCNYCNPKGISLNHSDKIEILTFGEIERIVRIFVEYFEFKKVRLTGGEPFARKDIFRLVHNLGEIKKEIPYELSATSNGILINGRIAELIQSGVDRINFSLDTFKRNRYFEITGADSLFTAINSIMQAIEINPEKVKLNMVVMKGINDDELIDFVDFAINNNVSVRFIEYMPFSNNGYDKNLLMNYNEMITKISGKYNLIRDSGDTESVSKDYYVENNNGKISFITSITEHFCNTCNRLRVTSDGKLKLCLFSLKDNDLDIKALIRRGASDNEIAEEITYFIGNKNEMHDTFENLIQLKSSSMITVGG